MTAFLPGDMVVDPVGSILQAGTYALQLHERGCLDKGLLHGVMFWFL